MKKRHTHYPDMQSMRNRANLVCMAIQTLSGLGIEVLSVDLNATRPLIEVCDSGRVDFLHGESAGQSGDGATRKVRKMATVCGCSVVWSELL